MTDKSKTDELTKTVLVEFIEGPAWCVKLDDAKRIIHELEERIAAMEDAAGSLVSDLHREMDRRMTDEIRVHELVDVIRQLDARATVATNDFLRSALLVSQLKVDNARLLLQRDDARRKCLEHLSDADKRKAAFDLDWRGLYDGPEVG